MMPILLFSLLAGLPLLLGLLFRVSAVYLFLSMAVGNLLVNYMSDDVILAVNAFSKGKYVPMVVQLVLLLAPVLLTLFVLKKSMPRAKIFAHLLPLIGCGLTLTVLALPLLPSDIQQQIFDLPAGDVLRRSQDLIIGITAIAVLLLAWSTRKMHHGLGHHGKHHK